MNIIDYIPKGRENAVTRTELCKRIGLPDRTVRELISQARRETCILNAQDGNGYFRPEKEDIPAVRGWLKQETARAKSIFWSAKGARKFLKGEGNGK